VSLYSVWIPFKIKIKEMMRKCKEIGKQQEIAELPICEKSVVIAASS